MYAYTWSFSAIDCPSLAPSSPFLFLPVLRTRFAGGVSGDAAKFESERFLNLEMAREMESWREWGRVKIRSDEGLIKALIELLMADFEDLSCNLAAAERNSSAEDCRDDRSRFSIVVHCNFGVPLAVFIVPLVSLKMGCVTASQTENNLIPFVCYIRYVTTAASSVKFDFGGRPKTTRGSLYLYSSLI